MNNENMFKTIYCRHCGYQNDINYYEDYDFCPECDDSLITIFRYGVCEDCGKEVYLMNPLTNECDCGALYNAFGQKLLPREEWGDDCCDYDY